MRGWIGTSEGDDLGDSEQVRGDRKRVRLAREVGFLEGRSTSARCLPHRPDA